MPQQWTASCDEAKVLAEEKSAQEESESALTAQFEAIQSRRNDVARLEGLRDTALAQRDHLLGLSSVRAELNAARGRDGRSRGRDRVPGGAARSPPARKSWHG